MIKLFALLNALAYVSWEVKAGLSLELLILVELHTSIFREGKEKEWTLCLNFMKLCGCN